MLLNILLASAFGSVLALLGGVMLLWREGVARRFSMMIVSFAAGSLMAAAFLDLLPEAIEGAESAGGYLVHSTAAYGSLWLAVLAGVLTLFLIEKYFHRYHCHEPESHHHHLFGGGIVVGDTIHNFIDGTVIALAFVGGGPAVGFATTLAILLHEIPQEVGDFGVLLHAGWSKAKVFWSNFFVQLTSPLGAVMGYFFLNRLSPIIPPLLAYSAGIFIYIAISDLLPEIRRENRGSFGQVVLLLLGIALIWSVGVLIPE